MTEILLDGPLDARRGVILAHGAGAPMDSTFMAAFAEGISAAGIRVARFEFPYMTRRREDGRRRPPDRRPVLIECWRATIDGLHQTGIPRERLFIGGKSMGGRIASLIADEAGVAGVVCLGYPFHPPGKPERTRIEHLVSLRTPTLIVQGERDFIGDARGPGRLRIVGRNSRALACRRRSQFQAAQGFRSDGNAKLGGGDSGRGGIR